MTSSGAASPRGGKGFIGIHIGTGKYSEKNLSAYKNILNVACNKAIKLLRSGGTAMSAAALAVSVLEDSTLVNAGSGSNLNWEGEVECDAGIMDGKTGDFGAVGALQQVRNPIKLALRLCQNQSVLDDGLLRPCMLVGPGALAYARAMGERVFDSGAAMVCRTSKRRHERYKKKVLMNSAANRQTDKKRTFSKVEPMKPHDSGKVTSDAKRLASNSKRICSEAKPVELHVNEKVIHVHEGEPNVVVTKCDASGTLSEAKATSSDSDTTNINANITISNATSDVDRTSTEYHYDESKTPPFLDEDLPIVNVTKFDTATADETGLDDEVGPTTNAYGLQPDESRSSLDTPDATVNETPVEVSNENPSVANETSQIEANMNKPHVFAIPHFLSKPKMVRKSSCDASSSKSSQSETKNTAHGSQRKRPVKILADKPKNTKQRKLTDADGTVKHKHNHCSGNEGATVNLNLDALITETDAIFSIICVGIASAHAHANEASPLKVKFEELKRTRDKLIQGQRIISEGKINPRELSERELNISMGEWDRLMEDGDKLRDDIRQQRLKMSRTDDEGGEMQLDTVGAVCVDMEGNVASCASSGGIILKLPGRLGQSCIRGAGCWAQNPDPVACKYGQAVSTSGQGEYLIRTALAEVIGRAFRRKSLDSPDGEEEVDSLNSVLFEKTVREEFLESTFLQAVSAEKTVGVILLLTSPQDSAGEEFLWAHNSPSFGVGYMSTEDSHSHTRMSSLPDESANGRTVNVESVRC